MQVLVYANSPIGSIVPRLLSENTDCFYLIDVVAPFSETTYGHILTVPYEFFLYDYRISQ